MTREDLKEQVNNLQQRLDVIEEKLGEAAAYLESIKILKKDAKRFGSSK